MPTITTLQPTSDVRALVSARLQLGAAVLKPGERVAFITPDNKRGDYVELHRAVRDGRAYMGRVDDDVLALDCDPSERPSATAGLAVVIAALRAHAIEPV